jgi:hypothetical protein
VVRLAIQKIAQDLEEGKASLEELLKNLEPEEEES